MARIPFPTGLTGTELLPQTRRTLVNCFNNLDGKIIPRPGVIELNTTNFLARGQFTWNGALYIVTGFTLIKVTNVLTGEFDVINTIEGSANVQTAIGFVDAVIVVPEANGKIYTLDKSDAVSDISGNDNFVPCRDVAFINDRMVYIPFDGSPAFFSDAGFAGVVQATSFFDAQTLPDLNNSVFVISNTLYIGGEDSIELFRNVTTSQVFQRIDGARIDWGVIGAVLESSLTNLFIGREKEQVAGIYATAPGAASKISNEVIDLILTTYTQAELETATSTRFKWRGYDIAVFSLARDSFGFFGGEWFDFNSFVGFSDVPFAATFINEFEGTYYVSFQDKIGMLAKVNFDYGQRIERRIDLAFEQEDGQRFGAQSFELGISQGFNEEITTVGLSMTRDNVLYGNTLYRKVGKKGRYKGKLVWNPAGGMGSYEGFMGIRIQTHQDLEFATNFLVANFR